MSDPHAKILSTTRDLLASKGLAALTIDEIAVRAGVSKTTIYRRWRNKDAVALDAFVETLDRELVFPDTGSVRDDLRQEMAAVVAVVTDPPRRDLWTGLVGQAQTDPELAKGIAERLIEPRRQGAFDVVRRGIERGELHPDVDPETVVEAAYGAIHYRLLITKAPVSLDVVDRVLDHVLGSLAADGPGPGPGPRPRARAR